MLDIIHYLFESDSIDEKETQKAKLKMRRTIYKVLYMRTYTWQDGEDEYRDFGTQDVNANPMGGRSTELTHKGYIPPTPVNADSPMPYGNVLDAPLG